MQRKELITISLADFNLISASWHTFSTDAILKFEDEPLASKRRIKVPPDLQM